MPYIPPKDLFMFQVYEMLDLSLRKAFPKGRIES